MRECENQIVAKAEYVPITHPVAPVGGLGLLGSAADTAFDPHNLLASALGS